MFFLPAKALFPWLKRCQYLFREDILVEKTTITRKCLAAFPKPKGNRRFCFAEQTLSPAAVHNAVAMQLVLFFPCFLFTFTPLSSNKVVRRSQKGKRRVCRRQDGKKAVKKQPEGNAGLFFSFFPCSLFTLILLPYRLD